MKALMLAAGLARRLYGDENEELPKSLLRFDDETLLARHIDALVQCGVDSLTVVVGHRHEDVCAELERVAPAGFVSTVFNPRFTEGPKLSLAAGEAVLRAGETVLFMDADVLYHVELMERLVNAPDDTCFVMDREFQSTDDFVKVCLLGGRMVDFGKVVGETHDTVGEWPGLCKFDAATAASVADHLMNQLAAGNEEGAYEEAFRAALVTARPGTFGVADITGLPWVEIDYPSDLDKAERTVYPRISRHRSGSSRSA